ncbi:TPA: hypothetical protein ACYRTT_003555 [Escherichia coli]|nr:hypothetical protein [Escherichia coli]MCN2706158.1 hypothetical protein [Escherichia coli]MCN6105159.1 hypothetical protein [Escherichia coli]MDF7199094.1 hypothetical protein [Escherichia coli]MDY8302320.1 hypothetical protein [Escherichia coli]MDY8443332.1 hypothetical protein [Escherichia coli]
MERASKMTSSYLYDQ